MDSRLIALNRPAEAKAAGVPVETEHQLRWMERTADEKGLRGCFVRIGRRVFLDPERFHELARRTRASTAKPPQRRRRAQPAGAASSSPAGGSRPWTR